MLKKVLFIDRDGTIIAEPQDEKIDSFAKMQFLKNSISALSKISKITDFELVMVTNQDGLGTSSFPESDFWPVHNLMLSILASEGIYFSEILIDKSFEHENLPSRKPGLGMLQKYLYGNYDLKNSFVIGDRKSDVQLAKNLGSKSIFIGENYTEADFCTRNWN